MVLVGTITNVENMARNNVYAKFISAQPVTFLQQPYWRFRYRPSGAELGAAKTRMAYPPRRYNGLGLACYPLADILARWSSCGGYNMLRFKTWFRVGFALVCTACLSAGAWVVCPGTTLRLLLCCWQSSGTCTAQPKTSNPNATGAAPVIACHPCQSSAIPTDLR